jgi:hypothetical protein
VIFAADAGVTANAAAIAAAASVAWIRMMLPPVSTR